MPNFLVTGGAGFIGSAFVRNLLVGHYLDLFGEVDKIFILDALTYASDMKNLTHELTNKKVEFHKGNICDPELTLNLITKSDYILNFAAESHVDNSIKDATDFVKTNIFGVQMLLDQLRKFPEKRYVQISTDEVYGSLKENSASEESLLKPNSPYSASKASGDLLVRAYSETYGLNTIITRSANNFGPNQNQEKLIPNLIAKAMRNIDFEIYGDGKNIREWIHVDDNCDAIAIAASKGKAGNVYNIGGSPQSNLEVAELILNFLSNSKSSIKFVKDRLGHDFRYSISDLKIKELGYLPKKNFFHYLPEVIEQTIIFHSL